jgi:hypothetical protein
VDASTSRDLWDTVGPYLLIGLSIVIWAIFTRIMSRLDKLGDDVNLIKGKLGLDE